MEANGILSIRSWLTTNLSITRGTSGTTNVGHIELTATSTGGATKSTTEAAATTAAKVAAGRTTDETRLGLTILE